MKNTKAPLILSSLFIIGLFVLAEILAHTYEQSIADLVQGYSLSSKIFFVAMAAIAVIIPVWSNIFLLPFGVAAWGPLTTALLCISGWWIGSVTAFAIARSYKEILLQKYPSFAYHHYIDQLISSRHHFFSLIFLRTTLPVDILSYALGLFSKRISWKANAITTLIGITPFAFIFSYIGVLSLPVEISILLFTSLLFILYVIRRRNIIAS